MTIFTSCSSGLGVFFSARLLVLPTFCDSTKGTKSSMGKIFELERLDGPHNDPFKRWFEFKKNDKVQENETREPGRKLVSFSTASL